MTATADAEPKRGVGRPPNGIPKFTVEFGSKKNNGWFVISSLEQLQVRGAWLKHQAPGRIPPHMGSMPDVPGAYMTVEPNKGHALLFDPTTRKDLPFKDFWKQYNTYSQSGGTLFNDPSSYGPFEDMPLELPPDKLKTLLLELHRMSLERWVGGGKAKIKSAYLRVVEGRIPALQDIEALVGRQLYDPGCTGYRHPRYVDQLPEWYEKIDETAQM